MSDVSGGNAAQYPPVVEALTEDTLVTRLKVDGQVVTPTSATVTLYGPGGSALVTNATCTISGKEVSYAFDVSATYSIDRGYKAVWRITYGGEVYTRTMYFDVVRRRFRSTLTDDDITGKYPYLASMNVSTFKPWMSDAWEYITQYLAGRVHAYPGNVFRPEKFFQAHLMLTLSEWHCYNALSGNPVDVDVFKCEKYRERGEELLALAASVLDFDVNDDGVLNSSEEGLLYSTVRGVR